MDYDFIVGFTLFTPKGFRTMYRHFDKIDTAKMFASNVNIKDNNKIYIDLKYMQDKIKAIIEEIDNILADVNADDRTRLIAERNYYKKQVKELEARLNRVCSLDDCNEEFEL